MGRADFHFPALELLENEIGAGQGQLPALAKEELGVSRNSPRNPCKTRARKSPSPQRPPGPSVNLRLRSRRQSQTAGEAAQTPVTASYLQSRDQNAASTHKEKSNQTKQKTSLKKGTEKSGPSHLRPSDCLPYGCGRIWRRKNLGILREILSLYTE